ncbi:lysostaphin resistance A-like protein [Aquimarina sp. SS2-1]|uniref:CPBP family intramembrane glutamic endopeptidase n=1 Tax=Aquimarina besae TaxID=3342247 RepID=UPI00366FA339
MKLPKSILLTIIYLICTEVIGLWIFLIPEEEQYLNVFEASHLVNTIIALIVIILFFKFTKRSDVLIFNKTENKCYIFSILLGIGFVFFQRPLNLLYYGKISTTFFNCKLTLDNLASFTAIASILVVPIIEELFFRKYIQGGLSENYKPYKSIIFASLLFAFIHIPFISLFYNFMNFSFHKSYIALFGGIVSGILYYKSKSIVPSITFHIFWNLTSYIV